MLTLHTMILSTVNVKYKLPGRQAERQTTMINDSLKLIYLIRRDLAEIPCRVDIVWTRFPYLIEKQQHELPNSLRMNRKQQIFDIRASEFGVMNEMQMDSADINHRFLYSPSCTEVYGVRHLLCEFIEIIVMTRCRNVILRIGEAKIVERHFHQLPVEQIRISEAPEPNALEFDEMIVKTLSMQK